MNEAPDKKKLNESILKNKLDAFNMLKYIVNKDIDFKSCGYASIEDAAIKIVKETNRLNEVLIRAYEKKYP